VLSFDLGGDVADDAQDVWFALVDKGRAVDLDVKRRAILAQIDRPGLERSARANGLQVFLKERVVVRVNKGNCSATGKFNETLMQNK
jgi:hypothetical protein